MNNQSEFKISNSDLIKKMLDLEKENTFLKSKEVSNQLRIANLEKQLIPTSNPIKNSHGKPPNVTITEFGT